jgi:hypothetical protein
MCAVALNVFAANLPVSCHEMPGAQAGSFPDPVIEPDGHEYVTFIVPNAADGFEIEKPFAVECSDRFRRPPTSGDSTPGLEEHQPAGGRAAGAVLVLHGAAAAAPVLPPDPLEVVHLEHEERDDPQED